jgi:formate dehydrogenase subunit beta
MATTVKIDVDSGQVKGAIQALLDSILRLDDISAVLAPRLLPMKNIVMPALVSDPDQLADIDPLAPAFAMNSAKIVSRISRKPMGGKVAVLMRPCEIRAFIELVKLKQGRPDELVILGMDCLGAYANTDFQKFVAEDPTTASDRFFKNAIDGNTVSAQGIDLATACKACEQPVPEGADIIIGLLGVDVENQLLIQSRNEKGDELLRRLELDSAKFPPKRDEAISALKLRRQAYRDNMFAETAAAVENLEKLTAYLGGCINCYNCRVACPVCYCRECVFVTDVFNHEPSQYLQWAQRKGAIKMPTDTVFYHLTRLAHMSTACVGCGQCSNACPNDIPVMELFRTVAAKTQGAFGYEAGRSIEDKPPLSEFRENEFQEVVGIGA